MINTSQLRNGCRSILLINKDSPATKMNVGNRSLNKKDKYTHKFTGEFGMIELINRQSAMKMTSAIKKGRDSPANSAPQN